MTGLIDAIAPFAGPDFIAKVECLRSRCEPSSEDLALALVANHFAGEVAQALDVAHHLVVRALYSVPDNLLDLLESPQGWAALSDFIAIELGSSQPDWLPRVH